LALQIVTELLNQADSVNTNNEDGRVHAAFYFSLEAHPTELRRQVQQFTWGYKRYKAWGNNIGVPGLSGEHEYSNGLYLVSVPPPAESLNALLLKIRQTIAGEFKRVKNPVAIVIDPIGAVETEDDFGTNLTQLTELANMHRTFLFLLVEQYAFNKYTSIEHYSQSIIHLEHDPGQQQHRRLYVQKARGQAFRSGYHSFELQSSNGIRVFPSVDAQSAHAHERLSALQSSDPQLSNPETVAFFPEGNDSTFLGDEQIEAGSAVFLMGPPGTFKEYVASEFAVAEQDGATIYVSFKADFDAIRKAMEKRAHKKAELIDSRGEREQLLTPTTYFYDARSPLLTPEEILFTVNNFIATTPAAGPSGLTKSVPFRRAIIWGLRRLYDFPNFKDNIVRFLEALVTTLKSQRITTLVVDWPDKTSKMSRRLC
jgi:KaiC/GvpD/RAD55 family RecA-like ATPase